MGNLSIMFVLPLLLGLLKGQPTEQPTPAFAYILEIDAAQYARFETWNASQVPTGTLSRIHPGANFYRYATSVATDTKLDACKRNGYLSRWQYDRAIIPRAIPNDPLWPDQWNLQKIALAEAWDRTTGGVTIHGDTIVIAILDTGFDTDHEDLRSNIWRNHGEIPGDGIDNDMNGYIDDYLGLNVRLDNDQHPRTRHGTNVAGVIGAQGNNATGIAGVNWHVKLLFISGIQNESDIIEGYMYCKALRDAYDSSNGTKGAYVVATNLSAGIDNAKPADHQMWCDQYDLLGQSGILSICATTNGNINVDQLGDMPTTCPSEYLIAVTMSDMNDNKPVFAGFGVQHIDLAAPGTFLTTTALAHGYEDFDGTSAAAPHVAGVVGLLYGVACHDILVLGETDRPMLARQMKNIILEYVDKVSTLAGLTMTGGRLNAARAVNGGIDLCNKSGDGLELLSITPNPSRDVIMITFHVPDINPVEINLYDNLGRLVLREVPVMTIPGIQILDIPVRHFPSGIYHLALQRGKTVSAKSLVIR